MLLLHSLLDFFLHIDTHLGSILQEYGALTYLILFLIIFCETGLVVTPFLPGDSLLFAAGAFAARGSMNGIVLFVLLSVAAIAGNTTNYFIGRHVGVAAYGWNSRFIKQEHLQHTKQFFAVHGGLTIIITRFMPIVRTFAPFVAGIGHMPLRTFFAYNIAGGLLWVTLFVGGGYFFGTLPFVEKNFSAVILVIIVFSVLPGLFAWMKRRVASV